ncbi:MAG: organic solvent resistance ABC transporter ATP-binding protein [Acidobacteria bacterium]|nr:MAG: organic solvent resistance ABC transporter ATP-binding protein [Acidobacteriota bacterium]
MKDNQFVIRLEQVSKSFGNKRVLDQVSFRVARGSAFCILGRSGTGKSVTLKLMIGLIRPEQGKIFIADQEITGLESRELPPVRKAVGFLFQSAALFDSISVGENVAFPLRRHTNKSEKEIQEYAHKKLEQVGLENEYDRLPADLSGGMRKRAALARALALDPPILLVDEPSAGLDPITSAEIDNLLLRLNSEKDTTLVVVTHNIPSARRIGDELLVLHEGHIIAQGTANELDQSEHKVVREFMRSIQAG